MSHRVSLQTSKIPVDTPLICPMGNAAALNQPVKNSGCEDIPGREAQPVALAARERRQHPFPMVKTPPGRASAATGAGMGWR